jgi:aminopeptidase
MTTPSDFQQKLAKYAEVVVKVGLNLQPGQRLMIRGAPIQTPALVRLIATMAYTMGAPLVDTEWNDDAMLLIRHQHAPHDSFEEFSDWWLDAPLGSMKRGDAQLMIYATDPDLLKDQDPELVDTAQRTWFQKMHPASEMIQRSCVNWAVISAPIPSWAAKVFPDVPVEAQEATLWEAIFEVCRLNDPDPVAAWQSHIGQLASRKDYLNCKQYAALKYSAPGTDLTIGLPRGHIWTSGSLVSESGITFTANLPTEEVWTMPHKDGAVGTLRSTRPLMSHGTLIEDFSLTFEGGRVINSTAKKGDELLRKLLDTDEGARRLGEVALVPHSSPISQSGLLFYNTLFDENAASHIALGAAYKFNLQGGIAMADDAFAAAGGNLSIAHVDFMIGSGEMDIDGITVDGISEPVMRSGEWSFDV